jgi:hypothetical protein
MMAGQSSRAGAMNHLYYGDNLSVLRDDTFKRAAREEDRGAQGALDL